MWLCEFDIPHKKLRPISASVSSRLKNGVHAGSARRLGTQAGASSTSLTTLIDGWKRRLRAERGTHHRSVAKPLGP